MKNVTLKMNEHEHAEATHLAAQAARLARDVNNYALARRYSKLLRSLQKLSPQAKPHRPMSAMVREGGVVIAPDDGVPYIATQLREACNKRVQLKRIDETHLHICNEDGLAVAEARQLDRNERLKFGARRKREVAS